jgi:hypothetical protein
MKPNIATDNRLPLVILNYSLCPKKNVILGILGQIIKEVK